MRAVASDVGSEMFVSLYWCLILLAMVPLVRSQNTSMLASIFGTSPISAASLWDGGLNISVSGRNGCQFGTGLDPAILFRDSVVESETPVATYGWSAFNLTLLPAAASKYKIANYVVWGSTATSHMSVILAPAMGFVLKTSIKIKFQSPSALHSNCSTTAAAQYLTIAQNSNGGYATATLSVSHEYDIQRASFHFDVALQYNVFVASPTLTVQCAFDAALNSGWTFVRLNAYTLRGTHAAVPTFNIPAGQTATVAVSVPNTATFLNVAPTPATSSFAIDAVDGNPVAFCQLSVPNITDKMLRNGNAVVRITLDRPSADAFVVYGTAVDGSQAWAGTVPVAQLPSGVSVAYVVADAQTILLNFTASSVFFMNAVASLVFTPRPQVLASQTAGCGPLRMQIVPASGNAFATEVRNVTERFLQLSPVTIQLRVEFALFLSLRNVPVLFRTTRTSPASTIETLFGGALGADNVTLVARTNLEGTIATIDIPPLPRYNVDFNATECLEFYFPGAAMVSNVGPITVTNPTMCIEGVLTNVSAAFASTGSNYTNATTLWDRGDVLALTLVGGVWNTSARWVRGTPYIYSALGTIEALGFDAVNYTNVTFSANGRVAYVPFVECRGISATPNEVGIVENFEPLLDNAHSVSMHRITFGIVMAPRSAVTFSCSGRCSTVDGDFNASISENDVRTSFGFEVQAIYDVLVNATELNLMKWAIFTRNATTLVSTTPLPTLTVVRVNNYTARFAFSAVPNFDITTDELSVVYLNASFLKNKLVQASPRGFLLFKANENQPTCLLTNVTPAISERAIQQSNVSMLLTTSTSMRAAACANLKSGAWVLAFTTLSQLPLSITVGNCSIFDATGTLPLILHQNSSYEISTSDALTFSFDRKYFIAQERCGLDPEVVIPVLPANAEFALSYFNSLTNATVSLSRPTPFAAVLSERLFRAFGLSIRIQFSGELLTTCSFQLQRFVNQRDTLRPASNFEALFGSVNMTATNASACRANVSTSAVFEGTVLPNQRYDITTLENISFFIATGVGSGASQPVSVNSTVVLVAESEDAVAYLNAGANNATSMRPLPLSTVGVRQSVAPNASWSFVGANISAELLSRGGYTYTFVLAGDRWMAGAPALLVAAISALNQNFSATSTAVTQSTITQLFPSTTATVAFNATSLLSTVTIHAPSVPSFYLTEDIYLVFAIPPLAIDSGIATTPSWMGLNVSSGPPVLEASGPAYRGGTRRLLLGMLYLTVRLINDNFLPESISGPTICPPTFDTCSATVDATRRLLNISFPPQNLVLFSTTSFPINLTSDNVVSHRPISNAVAFELSVESGILRTITVGSQAAADGVAIDETQWRSGGGVTALTFVLDGDSFVGSSSDIVAALRQRTQCFPSSDAYGFCTRLSFMMTGTVQALEVGRQSIRIDLQPDNLFDVYRDELVVLAFGGVATSSTFAPIFLTNLSFRITASSGAMSMSATQTSSASNPIPSSSVRDGTSQQMWTFTLLGERWNVGATFPFVATPTGQSIRQLVLSAFVGSSSCATCFNARKPQLFASDVTVSNDRRTLWLAMVGDSGYETALLENITIAFFQTELFLSGLLPSRTNAGDWFMFVGPSGVRVTASIVEPRSLAAPTSSSSLVTLAVPEETLRSKGVNVTMAVTTPPYVWDYTAVNASTATFASAYTTSDRSTGVEPRGYLARRVAMARVYFPPSSVNGALLTFAFLPDAQYALTRAQGEVISVTFPQVWLTLPGSTTKPSVSIAPGTLQLHIQVTQAYAVVLVKRLSLATSCAQIGTVNALTANMTNFLRIGASTLDVASAAPVQLNPQYCNVSVRVLTTTDENALTVRDRLLAAATAALTDCCSIALAYHPETPPSDDVLLAAIGVQATAAPEEADIGLQLTWVFTSLLLIAALAGIYYLYRRRVSGGAFSGTSRTRADDHMDLWAMKMQVEDEISEEEQRRLKRIADARKHLRVHEDAEGRPRFSDVPIAGAGADTTSNGGRLRVDNDDEAEAHESVFAGQPARSIHLHSTTAAAPLSIVAVDVPIIEQEDDIPIPPIAIDGMVTSKRGDRRASLAPGDGVTPEVDAQNAVRYVKRFPRASSSSSRSMMLGGPSSERSRFELL